MTTKFILSLDCEGKWGIADKLSDEHKISLSEERLAKAYNDIINLVSYHNIPTTFAFVGLFQKSKKELDSFDWDWLLANFPYVQNAHDDFFHGTGEGWDGDWAVNLVKDEVSNGMHHEIGCHGGTHTPFDRMNQDQASLDLTLCPDVATQTFIYPRGGLGHTDALMSAGIHGYRLVRPGNRVSRILDEFNLFHGPEKECPPANLVEIPAGYFINWKSGIRKHIPVWASRARIRSIFDKAGNQNDVIHFWSHPENIASAPQTLDILEIVLSEAKKARNNGNLQIMTQKQYCDYVSGTTSSDS